MLEHAMTLAITTFIPPWGTLLFRRKTSASSCTSILSAIHNKHIGPTPIIDLRAVRVVYIGAAAAFTIYIHLPSCPTETCRASTLWGLSKWWKYILYLVPYILQFLIIRDFSLPNLIFDICIMKISSVDQFFVSNVSHL